MLELAYFAGQFWLMVKLSSLSVPMPGVQWKTIQMKCDEAAPNVDIPYPQRLENFVATALLQFWYRAKHLCLCCKKTLNWVLVELMRQGMKALKTEYLYFTTFTGRIKLGNESHRSHMSERDAVLKTNQVKAEKWHFPGHLSRSSKLLWAYYQIVCSVFRLVLPQHWVKTRSWLYDTKNYKTLTSTTKQRYYDSSRDESTTKIAWKNIEK